MTNYWANNPDLSKMIFVFGSNIAGRHGKGAALDAMRHHGAQYGVGEGRTGSSYAIPTKDANIKTLPLHVIRNHVIVFLSYARVNSHLNFQVTRIGCGLAGYKDAEIAPMFEGPPENCYLPEEWRTETNNREDIMDTVKSLQEKINTLEVRIANLESANKHLTEALAKYSESREGNKNELLVEMGTTNYTKSQNNYDRFG